MCDNPTLVVKVESAGFESGNYARISLNDVPVEMNLNENNHSRGLHIVTIHPSSGKVKFAQVFDTYESSSKLEEFIVQNNIPDD